jgi:hypothetical protein
LVKYLSKLGDSNTMQGNGNTHIGFNSYIHGDNDKTVGNRLNLLGSNVYMFGPQADPRYYS